MKHSIRPKIDRFTITLLSSIFLASILPLSDKISHHISQLSDLGISLLFFLHGARLSRKSVYDGLSHWRLHTLILACSFVLFPLLAQCLQPIAEYILTPQLALGIVFLSILPSTVQSSIAFTAIAGGNVSAAVCAASFSSVFGIFITPIIFTLLIGAQNTSQHQTSEVYTILIQLILPFTLGHCLRPWISTWVAKKNALLKVLDQGTIVLIVFSAFISAKHDHLWQQIPIMVLANLILLLIVFFGLLFAITKFLSRRLGFSTKDEIAIIFCGSKKSLANGVMMAKMLLPATGLSATILPLIIYHQVQLIICAMIAAHYAKKGALLSDSHNAHVV